MKKSKSFGFLALILITCLFAIAGCGSEEKADAKEEAAPTQEQQDQLEESLDKIVEDNEDILGIRKKPGYDEDGTWWDVSVSDRWYNSQKHEKKRFAEDAGATVRQAVYDSGIVAEDDSVNVYIVDERGDEVATWGIWSGEYEIKE